MWIRLFLRVKTLLSDFYAHISGEKRKEGGHGGLFFLVLNRKQQVLHSQLGNKFKS